MLKLYNYAKCSTCRDATRWLREHGHAFDELPIRETPPAEGELRRMLAAHEGRIRRLFNTSGQDYRALGLADKIDSLTEAEAFGLLRGNGMLVKRPFLIGSDVALVGFDPKRWETILKRDTP
jgi:arsenate reductase